MILFNLANKCITGKNLKIRFEITKEKTRFHCGSSKLEKHHTINLIDI